MFRALSTRRGPGRYEKLSDETASVYLLHDVEPQLKRVTTLPPGFFGSKEISIMKPASVPEYFPAPAAKLSKAKSTKKAEKVHPLFGLMDPKRRKKATARPEFLRYMEYLKEGGLAGAR